MLIKGAMICDANNEYRGDVRIEEKKITAVSRSITPRDDEEVLNAEGLVLLPGAIDLNAQISEFSCENLSKLSKKCAKGGITQVALMGGVCDVLKLELINALNPTLQAEILNIVDALRENTLNELATLHKKGAKGFFVKSQAKGNLLRRVCEFALMFDVPVFFECVDENLSANGVINDGELSARLGLPGILPLSETKEVAQISEFARFMGIKAVFLAIAAQRSLEIIQHTKNTKGRPTLYTQTSIHHLMLTENICNNYNTAAKIKPPLKSESTRTSLLKSVKKGEIELLSALQSEKSLAQKDLSFEEAAFGIDMAEHFLPMCYTLLVKNSRISMQELSKILSYNPAQVLGLNKGLIEIGYDADLVLLDTKESYVVENMDCPYYDSIFYGNLRNVFVGGKRVL